MYSWYALACRLCCTRDGIDTLPVIEHLGWKSMIHLIHRSIPDQAQHPAKLACTANKVLINNTASKGPGPCFRMSCSRRMLQSHRTTTWYSVIRVIRVVQRKLWESCSLVQRKLTGPHASSRWVIYTKRTSSVQCRGAFDSRGDGLSYLLHAVPWYVGSTRSIV